MPIPGEVVAIVVVGLAVVLSLRLLLSVPAWVRRVRRPETRAIRVVGVGGGGNNAVDRMVRAGFKGVSFVGLNTDAQALRRSSAATKVRIGEATTGGLGSGGDPAVGRKAAEEDAKWIAQYVGGADLVFVTAGLGGGTGSGAAPIVAASARDQGALTIGVVTKPFAFEGSQRKRIADVAAAELADHVDALIVVPNDRAAEVLAADTSMIDAFGVVDDVLLHTVRGIIDLIGTPGLINLDFADVRSVMQNAGPAVVGLGRGSGEHRATDAAREAIASPLIEATIEGARGILLNVSGPSDLRLQEVSQAADEIRSHADPDANIIFGASFNGATRDEVVVTVIATGLAGRASTKTSAAGETALKTPPPAEVPQVAPPTKTPSRPTKAAAAPRISATSGVGREPAKSPPDLDDDLEVPSFLRRRGPSAGRA